MTNQVNNDMDRKADRRFAVLAVLVAGLLVAVLAQSFIILQMHRRFAGGMSPPGVSPMSAVKQHSKTTSPAAGLKLPFKNDKDLFPWSDDDWDPFKEMRSMQDRINHMFGNAFNRFQDSDDFGTLFRKYSFAPDMNVEDRGSEYQVTVDLPGANDSQLDVNLEGQRLTISGSIQSESQQSGKGTILQQERRSGRFERVVTLPSPVKSEKMTVTNKAGVVYITIPKAS